MCWFALVRKMWGFLITSHVPINDNENLATKPYFCLVSLANLSDLLRPVGAKSIILGIFVSFSPSLDGIPLGAVGNCLENQNFFKFYMLRTSSEAGLYITSDTDTPLLTGLTCTRCTGCKYEILFLLFSG